MEDLLEMMNDVDVNAVNLEQHLGSDMDMEALRQTVADLKSTTEAVNG